MFAIDRIARGLAASSTRFTPQVINRSGAAAPPALTNQVLQLVGGTAGATLLLDAFAGSASFIGRRADGAPGAPSAVVSGGVLAQLIGRGYGADAYLAQSSGSIAIVASQTFTNSAAGAQINFNTIPNNSVTAVNRWVMGNDGHFVPGATAVYDVGSTARSIRDIYLHPSASLTPTNNGDLVIQATSDTSLTFKYKGSDGVVRSASLTLA